MRIRLIIMEQSILTRGKIYTILLITFISICNFCIGQQKHIQNAINNGKGGVVNINMVDEKGKVLFTNKYLDIKRPLRIKAGALWDTIPERHLKNGFYPFDQMWWLNFTDTNTLKIQLKDNKLLISGKTFSFDDEKVIAQIKENKVPKEFKEYATDSSLEVLNIHDIPVFRIRFRKSINQIEFSGVVFNEIGYNIIGEHDTYDGRYPASYLHMKQEQRDSILYDIKNRINQYLNPNFNK